MSGVTLNIDHAVIVLVGNWINGTPFQKSTLKPLKLRMAAGDSLTVDYTMHLQDEDLAAAGATSEVTNKSTQLLEILSELNDLAAWPDGAIGTHMDEPHAAMVARRLLAKYAKPKHLPTDDTEGGLHD